MIFCMFNCNEVSLMKIADSLEQMVNLKSLELTINLHEKGIISDDAYIEFIQNVDKMINRKE